MNLTTDYLAELELESAGRQRPPSVPKVADTAWDIAKQAVSLPPPLAPEDASMAQAELETAGQEPPSPLAGLPYSPATQQFTGGVPLVNQQQPYSSAAIAASQPIPQMQVTPFGSRVAPSGGLPLAAAAGATLSAFDAPRRFGGVPYLGAAANMIQNPSALDIAALGAGPLGPLSAPVARMVTDYGGSKERGEAIRESAYGISPGVGVGLDVLTDPLTYLAPGALGKVGARFPALKPVTALVEGIGPKGALPYASGTALGTEIASRTDIPFLPEPAERFLGGAAGGIAGLGVRGLVAGGGKPPVARAVGDSGAPREALPSAPVTPRRYEVPELGTSGAQRAIAIKEETLPQTAMDRAPTLIRRAAALVNPKYDLEPTVYRAYNAEAATRATLQTEFDAKMDPLVRGVETALKEEPPRYIGPAGNKIQGTFKDIADHPDFYVLSPRLRSAIDAWDDNLWQTSAKVRGEFGVDVAPYESGVPGAVYAPTVPKKGSIEQKAEFASAGLSPGARVKERAYTGAYERGLANEQFVPETGVRELTRIHNTAMSSAAANNTFKLGVGGKTKTEVMTELHPELAAKRDTALKQVDSVRGRLETAERQSKGTVTAAMELQKAMEEVRDAVDEKWYMPIETAQRHAGKRIDELLRRGEIRRADAVALKQELATAMDQLDGIRTAWNTAAVDPYVLDRNTFRYVTPEQAKSIDEVRRLPTGFTKQAAAVLDEARSMHLAGDASPLFINVMLGFWQDPRTALRVGTQILLSGDPQEALLRIARTEADDVAEWTTATGRQLGKPLEEFPTRKGVGRIPAVGKLEDKMWAVTRRAEYEAWKADRDLLQKMNPNMSRADAAHEAASFTSKSFAALNTAERGVSGLRGAAERSFITSTSFLATPAMLIKDMTAGIAKLATGQPLRGREQLALIRGLTMAGTMTATAVGSAMLAAESQGKDPFEAAKEVINPKSKYFWSIQLGGGRYVPIGGPMRSFVKAMWPNYDYGHGIPGEGLPGWLETKVLAPISGAVRLGTNKDWRGRPIRNGDAIAQAWQSLSYALEQIVPISGSVALEGARRGDDVGDTAFEALTQFTGGNVQRPSPMDEINKISREKYGADFYDLKDPLQQKEIEDANPDLFREQREIGLEVNRPSSLRAEGADAARAEFTAKQEALDTKLEQTGDGKHWRNQHSENLAVLAGVTDYIYKDAPKDMEVDARLDGYYTALDAGRQPDGSWDAGPWEAYMDSLPADDREWIETRTGLSREKTAGELGKDRDVALIADSGYWEVYDSLAKEYAAFKGWPADITTRTQLEAYVRDGIEEQLQQEGRTPTRPTLDALVEKNLKPYFDIAEKDSKAARNQLVNVDGVDIPVWMLLYKWGYKDELNAGERRVWEREAQAPDVQRALSYR